MGLLGRGCSIPESVSDPEECRAAATQLGRIYAGPVHDFTVQSGCYYSSANGRIVEFNHATPDITTPQGPDYEIGGVCKRGIYILYHIFSMCYTNTGSSK